MKLFLLFFLFFTFSTSTFSQSFVLLNAELEKSVAAGTETKTSLQIKNISKKPIRLAIKSFSSEGNIDASFQVCIHGKCWDYITDMAAIELAPGQLTEELSIKFRAGYENNSQDLTLNFYNVDNPGETLLHTFRFSVKDHFSNGTFFSKEGLKVSNAYPNPVSSFATIDYNMTPTNTSASVVIHDLLGNKMMEIPLEKSEISLKVPADALENGIYFYSLHINGNRVATKKMVVKK